jgi:hypothetical protein
MGAHERMDQINRINLGLIKSDAREIQPEAALQEHHDFEGIN